MVPGARTDGGPLDGAARGAEAVLRGRPVAWMRVRSAARIRRVLLPAIVAMVVGLRLFLAGLRRLEAGVLDPRLLGFVLLVAGPLAVLVALLRLLARDDVLLVRQDGLERRGPGERWQEPWDALRAIEADGRFVVLRRRDGSSRRLAAAPFLGREPATSLARTLERFRQKGAWGLL